MADHHISDPSYFQGTSFTISSDAVPDQSNYSWPNPAYPSQPLHYPKPMRPCPRPMYPRLSRPFPPGSFNSPLQMSHMLSNSPVPPLPPPSHSFLVPEFPYLMSSQPLPPPSSFMPSPLFAHPGQFRLPNQREPFQHQFSPHNSRQSRFPKHHGRHKNFSDTVSERGFRTNKQSDTGSVTSFRSLDERPKNLSDTSSEKTSKDSNLDPEVNCPPKACKSQEIQQTMSSNKTNTESAEGPSEGKPKESNSGGHSKPAVVSIVPVFPKQYWSEEDVRTSAQLEESLLEKFEQHTIRVHYPDVVLSEDHILSLHPSLQSLDNAKNFITRPCYFEIKLQDPTQTDKTLTDLAKMSLEPGGAKLRPSKHRPWFSSRYQVDPTTLIITNIERHMDEDYFLSLCPRPASVFIQKDMLTPGEMTHLRRDLFVKKKKQSAHVDMRQAILIFASVEDAQRALRNENMWRKVYEGQKKIVRLRRYKDRPEFTRSTATDEEDTFTVSDATSKSATGDASRGLSTTHDESNVAVTDELEVGDDNNVGKKNKPQENISLSESVIERTMGLCINSQINSTNSANSNLSVSKHKVDSKCPTVSKIGTKSAMICKKNESKESSQISPADKDNLFTKVISTVKNSIFSPISSNNKHDLANEIHPVQISPKPCSDRTNEESTRGSLGRNSRRSKIKPANKTYSVLKKECSDKKNAPVDSKQINSNKTERSSSILDTTQIDSSIFSTIGASQVKTVDRKTDLVGCVEQPLKKLNDKDITYVGKSTLSNPPLKKQNDKDITNESSVNKSTAPIHPLKKQNDIDITPDTSLDKITPSIQPLKNQNDKEITSDSSVNKSTAPSHPLKKHNDEVITHDTVSHSITSRGLLCKSTDKSTTKEGRKRDNCPKAKSTTREKEVSPNAKLIGEKVQVEIENFLELKKLSKKISHGNLPTGIKSTHKQLFKNRKMSSDEKNEKSSKRGYSSKEHHTSRKSQKSSHKNPCKSRDKRCKENLECVVLLGERIPQEIIDYNLYVSQKYSDLVALDTRKKLEVRNVFKTMMKKKETKDGSFVSDTKKSQVETLNGNHKKKHKIHKSQSETSETSENVKNSNSTKLKNPSNKNPSSTQITVKNKRKETEITKKLFSEKNNTNKSHKSHTDSKKKTSDGVKMSSAKTPTQDGLKETRNCIEPSEMEKSELRLYSSSNASKELIIVTPEIQSNIEEIAKPNETHKKSNKKRTQNKDEKVSKDPKPYSKSEQKKKILNFLQNKKNKKSDKSLQQTEECVVRNKDVEGTSKITDANKSKSDTFDKDITQKNMTDELIMNIEEIENTPNTETNSNIVNCCLSNKSNQSNLDEISVRDSNSKLITKQSDNSPAHKKSMGDTTQVIKPVLHEPNTSRTPLDQINVGCNSMSHQANPPRTQSQQTCDGGKLLLHRPRDSITPLDQISHGDSLLFLVPESGKKLLDQTVKSGDHETAQHENSSQRISTDEENNERVKLDMANFHMRTMGIDIFSDCDSTIDFPNPTDNFFTNSVSNTESLIAHQSKLIDEVSIGDSSPFVIPTQDNAFNSLRIPMDEISVGDAPLGRTPGMQRPNRTQMDEISVGDASQIGRPAMRHPNRTQMDEISVGDASQIGRLAMRHPNRTQMDEISVGDASQIGRPAMRHPNRTQMDEISVGDASQIGRPAMRHPNRTQMDEISVGDASQIGRPAMRHPNSTQMYEISVGDASQIGRPAMRHPNRTQMDEISVGDAFQIGRPAMRHPNRTQMDEISVGDASQIGRPAMRHPNRTQMDEISVGDASQIGRPMMCHPNRSQMDEISVGDPPLVRTSAMQRPNRTQMDEISVGDASQIGRPAMRHPNRTQMDEISVGDASQIGRPAMRHPNRTQMDEISVGDASQIGRPMMCHPNRSQMDEISVGDPPLVRTSVMQRPNRTQMDEISVGDAPLVNTAAMRHPNRTPMDEISVGDSASIVERNGTSGSKNHVHTSEKATVNKFESAVAEYCRVNIFGEPIDIEDKIGKVAANHSKNSHAQHLISVGEGESMPVTYRIGPVYQNHLGLDDDSLSDPSDSVEEVHAKARTSFSGQKRVIKKTNKCNSMAINASAVVVQGDKRKNSEKNLTLSHPKKHLTSSQFSKQQQINSKHVSINGKTALDDSRRNPRLLDEVSTGTSTMNWHPPEALPPHHPNERETETVVATSPGNRPEGGCTLSGISNSFEGVSVFSRQDLSSISDLAMSAVSHSLLEVATSSDVVSNSTRDENRQGRNEVGDKRVENSQDLTRELNNEESVLSSSPTIPQLGEKSELPQKIPNKSAHQNPPLPLNDQESEPDIRSAAETIVHTRPATDEMSRDKSRDVSRLSKSLTSFRDLIESHQDVTQNDKTSIPLQVIQDLEYRNEKALDEMSTLTSLTEIQGETTTMESEVGENDDLIVQKISINTSNMKQYREYRHATQNDEDSVLGVSPIKDPSDKMNQPREIPIDKTYRNPAPILTDQDSVLGAPPSGQNDDDSVLSSFACVEDILEAKVNTQSKLIDTNTAKKEQYTTYQTRASTSVDEDSIISVFSPTKHKNTSKIQSNIPGVHRTNKKLTTPSKRNGKKNEKSKQQKFSDAKRLIENNESSLLVHAKKAQPNQKSNLESQMKSSSLQLTPLSESQSSIPQKQCCASSLKAISTIPRTPLLKQTTDAKSCPNNEQDQLSRIEQPLQQSRDFSFQTDSPLPHRPLFDNPLKRMTKDVLPRTKSPHKNSEKPSRSQKPLQKSQKQPLQTEGQSPPEPEPIFDIFSNTIIDDDSTLFSMLNGDEGDWGKRSVLDDMSCFDPPLVSETDRLEFFSKFDGASNNASKLRSADTYDLILGSADPRKSPEPLLDRDAIKCETPQSILDEDPDCPVYASSCVENASPINAFGDVKVPPVANNPQENLRKSKSSESSGRPVFNNDLSLYDLVEDNVSVEQNNRRISNDNASTLSSEDEHGLLNSKNKRRQRIVKDWDSTSGFDDDDGDKRKCDARQFSGWDSTSGFDEDEGFKKKRSLKMVNASVLDPVASNNRVFEECTRLYKSMMHKQGSVPRPIQISSGKPKIEALDKYRAFLSSSEDSDGDELADNFPRAARNLDHFLPSTNVGPVSKFPLGENLSGNTIVSQWLSKRSNDHAKPNQETLKQFTNTRITPLRCREEQFSSKPKYPLNPMAIFSDSDDEVDNLSPIDPILPLTDAEVRRTSNHFTHEPVQATGPERSKFNWKSVRDHVSFPSDDQGFTHRTPAVPNIHPYGRQIEDRGRVNSLHRTVIERQAQESHSVERPVGKDNTRCLHLPGTSNQTCKQSTAGASKSRLTTLDIFSESDDDESELVANHPPHADHPSHNKPVNNLNQSGIVNPRVFPSVDLLADRRPLLNKRQRGMSFDSADESTGNLFNIGQGYQQRNVAPTKTFPGKNNVQSLNPSSKLKLDIFSSEDEDEDFPAPIQNAIGNSRIFSANDSAMARQPNRGHRPTNLGSARNDSSCPPWKRSSEGSNLQEPPCKRQAHHPSHRAGTTHTGTLYNQESNARTSYESAGLKNAQHNLPPSYESTLKHRLVSFNAFSSDPSSQHNNFSLSNSTLPTDLPNSSYFGPTTDPMSSNTGFNPFPTNPYKPTRTMYKPNGEPLDLPIINEFISNENDLEMLSCSSRVDVTSDMYDDLGETSSMVGCAPSLDLKW